jgi:excisionase family DNA binding protein
MISPRPTLPPDLLTVSEAAALLRVAPQTMYTYLARRWISGRKIGRHWLIRRASVQRLLQVGPAHLRLGLFRRHLKPFG